MKLLPRQSQTEVPPELQPYYQSDPGSGLSAWRRWLLAAVALLVLIGIGVGIYFWQPWASPGNTTSTHKPSHSSTSKSGGTNTPSPQPPKTQSPASGAGGSSSTPPSNTQSGTANSQDLTNTGPGDTLALFAGVTVIAGAAYQIRLRRQVASNR